LIDLLQFIKLKLKLIIIKRKRYRKNTRKLLVLYVLHLNELIDILKYKLTKKQALKINTYINKEAVEEGKDLK
jgi:hypothetical protein